MLVGIVEKQERSQHGAFTHTLRSRKMHIPVYSDLGIGDIRAIYKNDFINPVIRIAFIHNGMLFLSKRKANCITESNKIDLPLEIYLRFGEKIDEGIKRLLHYPYPDGSTVHPRFGIKHLFKNEETNRLIYLHIAYIEDEKLLQSPFFQNGKLWTFQQIEHNLGKNFFSKCFEEEYLYLKESVKIWEEYK